AERMRFARLDVLIVGADIADVREGEGDDLLRVRRVGHHFLVAGHRRVEAELADGLPFRAEALSPYGAPVGEDHDSRRALGPLFLRTARVQGSYVGHGLRSLPSG